MSQSCREEATNTIKGIVKSGNVAKTPTPYIKLHFNVVLVKSGIIITYTQESP